MGVDWEKDYYKEVSAGAVAAQWTFFKFFYVVVVPVGLFCTVLSVGCWAWSTGTGVITRVVNPDAIVQNYEWYEQQFKDIKAMEGQVRDGEDAAKRFKEDNGVDASKWAYDQRQEYARLNSNVTGLHSAKRRMVEDYNARAGMITRNLWKRSDLPQHIEE